MSRQKGLGVGSISLILIFSVLCMSVFALLSLTTAANDKRLALRFAGSAESFYAADTAAEELLWKISGQLKLGNAPENIGNTDILYEQRSRSTVFAYLCPIDENRSIAVLAEYQDGKTKVMEWLETNNESWNPQEHIAVFGSNE